ncbi:excisionase [Klebsiella pneumoniae]
MIGLECVPISMYCTQTGENLEAINKRIQRGIWREGTQILKIPGVKERWVDLVEVTNWARRYSVPLTDKELGFNLEALDKMNLGGARRKK